jgi:hypothetical protein
MLTAYDDWTAVPATLQRIGTRLRQPDNPLLVASDELAAAAVGLGSAFADFYGDLQQELIAQGFAISAIPFNAAPFSAGPFSAEQ